MKISLLIIEDEIAIRDLVRFSLPKNEFELTDAENTRQALQILTSQLPHLILVDWMLPGQSGIDFIKWLKRHEVYKEIPIILLTAKAEEENKVKGLMSGADDYVTKPFSPNELIARIKTVLRRGSIVSPDDEIKHGELILNIHKHQLKARGNLVKLTPVEYKVLAFFMKHPHKTYSREQLITRIWGMNIYIDERTVDVTVRRLRDKLRQYGYGNSIQTVRGIGYQWSTLNESSA